MAGAKISGGKGPQGVKENLGQLFLTGIEGCSLSKEEADFIEKENIGGVLLFTRNYESPRQLIALTNSLQKLRRDYPLFIAVDHEGGRVIRFKKDFTQFPSMLELASLGSPKLIFEVGQIMANELKAGGINLNFAPCCDILTNPENEVIGDRAFGKSAAQVSSFTSSLIRGLQTNQVLACAKHFPGHGDTLEDSHESLPIVSTSLADLEKKEWVPFVKAIRAHVELIMMGHLLVREIDPQRPVSLSPLAHQILRQKMRYNRLIISDDMQMMAIKKHYATEAAAVMALRAGTDILEYRDMSETQQALRAVRRAVERAELTIGEGQSEAKVEVEAGLGRKINRIHACKKKFLAHCLPFFEKDISQMDKLVKEIGGPRSRRLSERIRARLS